MKFEFCGKKPAYLTFGKLVPGDVFHRPGNTSLYIKADDWDNALLLDSGALHAFADNEEVIPVEATIKWKDK